LFVLELSACRQKKNEPNESAAVATAEPSDFLNLDPETEYVGDEDCAVHCIQKYSMVWERSSVISTCLPARGLRQAGLWQTGKDLWKWRT